MSELVLIRRKEDGREYLKKAKYVEPTEEDIIGGVAEATYEQIAGYLDMVAEGDNYHELNGVYSALGRLIEHHGDAREADAVMRDILDKGGLYNLR